MRVEGLSLVNKVKVRETVESSGLIMLKWPLNFPLELHGQQNLEIQEFRPVGCDEPQR